MRTLALLAALDCLVSIPVPAQAGWKILVMDDPASLQSKRGVVAAKAKDGQSEAILEILCSPRGQRLSVSTSVDLRDAIDVRYRIDNGPQKQSLFDIRNSNSVSMLNLVPAEIGFAKSLSVELTRNEQPPLLFNFITSGANGVVNAISCAPTPASSSH